uniref:SLAM family member 7 n=1 Tax=Propithecus coquereli TaxID=379532 RepID=A0A2K6FFS1_PROCO
MAGSSTCLVLISLLWQLTGSAASGALKELVGALGGSVTFPLNAIEEQVDSISWTFNKTILVMVQPMGDEKVNVIVTQNRNKERMEFLGKGHSLKLSKLMKNDSGAYHVEIHRSLSLFPITQEYVLHVYESIEEKKTTDIHQEIPNFCPHAGENTEYDTISYNHETIPKEDPVNTLYSTVQIPEKMKDPHSLPTAPDTSRLFSYENVI